MNRMTILVVEDDPESWKAYQKEFEAKRSDAIRLRMSKRLARKDVSLDGQDIGKIFDRCMKETLYASGIRRI